MKKTIFCLQYQSPMNKIKPLTDDMLTAQKILVNQPEFFKNSNIVTVECE